MVYSALCSNDIYYLLMQKNAQTGEWNHAHAHTLRENDMRVYVPPFPPYLPRFYTSTGLRNVLCCSCMRPLPLAYQGPPLPPAYILDA